jgi:hypothetical protein
VEEQRVVFSKPRRGTRKKHLTQRRKERKERQEELNSLIFLCALCAFA